MLKWKIFQKYFFKNFSKKNNSYLNTLYTFEQKNIFNDMEKLGYIHLYTGNGKGKTTASLGVAIRTLCAGGKVFMGQFVKGMKYSEAKLGTFFPDFEIKQYGQGCFIKRTPTEKDFEMAKEGLFECREKLSSGNYNLIILDELNIALHFSLFTIEDVLEMIRQKAVCTEVIITGRYAPEKLIEIADLVTEMKEIKHYYRQGVLSRVGIDK